MNKQKLLLQRRIFTFFIIIIFSFIIINEKADIIFLPKVQKKFNSYLETNYRNMKNSLTMNKINYKDTKFQAKIVSKENKNHYFYLIYSKHQIKDTYQEDYLQGKKLFQHIQKKLEKEIKEKTNIQCTITILTTLDNYTEAVKDRILKEENLSQLKFYTIETEIKIENWNSKEITDNIISTIKQFQKNHITPKNFSFIITNKKEITESIKIENLTEDFIMNEQNRQIIIDILNDNNSKLVKQNKITYQYLN